MKILVLGTGVANDGVVMLLKEEGLDYDRCNRKQWKDDNSIFN